MSGGEVRRELIAALNRHSQAIDEARWAVVHGRPLPCQSALVDLDETCRELFGTESGGS